MRLAEFQRQGGVVEHREDVRDVRLLDRVDAEHLALLVDANAVRGIVLGGDEDRLAADAVHVDARPSRGRTGG